MSLSEEKRELLKRMLEKKGITATQRHSIPRRNKDDLTVASFLQEGLWFLDQLDPGKATYNVPGATRLRGRLDIAVLEKTLGEIIKRHEALRTTFDIKDGKPCQVISEWQSYALPVIDLEYLAPHKREEEALSMATDEARRPFDLAKGPLFRAFLLKLADDEHILVFNIHHIVTDGWSMGVFTRELVALFEAFSAGEASPLEDLPIQFADFAIWQRNWLQGENLKTQLDFWRGQLGGDLPVLEIPTDKPRPQFQTSRGEHETVQLSKSLSSALRLLTSKEHVTLFETLLAAYNLLLSFYTKQEDVIVGSPVANRSRKELEGLIGYFVNMLPLRSDLSGDPSYLELLRRVNQVTMDAYAHQDIPFGKLVEELQIKRDPSRNPVFQTEFILLTYEHAPAVYGYGFRSPIKQSMKLGDLTLTPVEVESGVSKFDIVVLLWDMPDGISGTFEYNADLFEAATIRKMIKAFEQLLQLIIENPQARISALKNLLSQDQSAPGAPRSELQTRTNLKKLTKMRRKPAKIETMEDDNEND